MDQYLLSVVSLMANPWYLPALAIGVTAGIALGALPGVSAPMALSMLAPLTYTVDPEIGFGLLIGLLNGVVFGGSIPAVLVNIPGTPGAVVSTIDGYPMTLRGEAGKALGIVAIASFTGGIFSLLCLMLSAPVIATVAMKFAPHDYCAVGILGLSITAGISGKSVLLGFWSALLGVLISTAGMDSITSQHRFVFGVTELLDGVPFLPIMVGLFGFSQVLTNMAESHKEPAIVPQRITNLLPSWKECKGLVKSIAQGSVIGTLVGALPGPGGSIAAFVSYDVIRRTSRRDFDSDPHDFGAGRLEGLAAPEAANNAVTGGILIPALTLGIPGDASAAIILGALMMHNITPGPLFFQNNIEIVYLFYNSLIISNIFMILIGVACLKLFVRMLSVSTRILTAVILILCVTGAYAVQNDCFGILVMLVFGVVGYAFRWARIPIMPLVLGVVLGPIIEKNLRQALIIEGGSSSGILLRPSSGLIFLLSVVMLLAPYRKQFVKSVFKERV